MPVPLLMLKNRHRARRIVAAVIMLGAGAAAALVIIFVPVRPPVRPRLHRPAFTRGWRLVFDSEFNGSSLNRGVWNAHNGWDNQNGVTDQRANVTLSHGHALLMLSSPTVGAEISTRHFGLSVGEYAQARIKFAGSGSTIYNWPAWWTSGPNWPQGGENDIAEGFGNLTVNYHSPMVTELTGPVPGNWGGAFHTYGLYRGRNFAQVFWDGRLVRTYRTADDGQPQTLLFTVGAGNSLRIGRAGALVVDYVRVWAPRAHP